jgi:hypothetical protein
LEVRKSQNEKRRHGIFGGVSDIARSVFEKSTFMDINSSTAPTLMNTSNVGPMGLAVIVEILQTFETPLASVV